MDLQTSKIELTKLILNIENHELLNKIKGLLTEETSDFWLSLSSSEKEEIKYGINQLNSNNRISVDDFLNKVS